MNKPPKLLPQKTLRKIAPPNISAPGGGGGGLYLEIALKYKVKQSKNGAWKHERGCLVPRRLSLDVNLLATKMRRA